MRKLLLLAALVLPLLGKGQCKIETGKIVSTHVGNTYKFFLDRKPVNTCYPVPDSASLWVAVVCSNGTYESNYTRWNDTLVYKVTGKVSLSASIHWWRNGVKQSRTDIEHTPYVNGTLGGCFEKIGVLTVTPPTIAPPLPPPPAFVPSVEIQNGVLVSNVGGVLFLASYPDFSDVTIKQFDNDFTFEIPSGCWYVYLILGDGTTLGNWVIQN